LKEGLVGAGELLAATTTTSAPPTSATALTTATVTQTLGSQGGSGRDWWVPLLAALLGALVGGVATLTASVLVKRWELRKTTRIRMYDELLPKPLDQYRRIVKTMRYFWERGEWSPVPPKMDLLLDAGELRRSGLIVGGTDAQIADRIWTLLNERIAYEVAPGGGALRWEPNEPDAIRAMYEELESLTDRLHKHLERKLTSRVLRRSLKTEDGHG
jgi:hypothetical protein